MPLAEVVAATKRLGSSRGTTPVEAELVGLVPEAALAGYPEDVPIAGGDPWERTIESRLSGVPG